MQPTCSSPSVVVAHLVYGCSLCLYCLFNGLRFHGLVQSSITTSETSVPSFSGALHFQQKPATMRAVSPLDVDSSTNSSKSNGDVVKSRRYLPRQSSGGIDRNPSTQST